MDEKTNVAPSMMRVLKGLAALKEAAEVVGIAERMTDKDLSLALDAVAADLPMSSPGANLLTHIAARLFRSNGGPLSSEEESAIYDAQDAALKERS